MGLFFLTAFTPYLDRTNAETLVLAALPWLLGAPIAFLAAWTAAAHDGEPSDDALATAVLVSTGIACTFALAVWFGATWTSLFAFQTGGGGRLDAFGYPTPTGIGIAIALPFAVAAGVRRNLVVGITITVLGLATIVLTGSRGPLIALGLGALAAFAVSGRLTARTILAGAAVAVVVGGGLVAVKYGTSPEQILSTFAAVNEGDGQRLQSWLDAVDVVVRNPVMGGGWGSLSRLGDPGLSGIAASHNMLLSAFADGGFPLGISFGAVLLYSIFKLWTNRTRVAPCVLAGATVLLVTGIWDIPNLRSYGAVMGGLALGMAARSPRLATDKGEAERQGGISRRHRRSRST
jgi:hypothetical protein